MSAIDWGKLIGPLIPVALFLLGATWGVVGWLVRRLEKALSDRLDALSKSVAVESEHVNRVERSLLELKAELPRDYVRREDHIRYSAIVEAKIDGLQSSTNLLSLKLQRIFDRWPDKKNGDEER